jgi:cobyrinic acid a,c-diamide synthase
MPGVVIAGTHSGCGKTTITLAVLAALKKKGMAVQPFKAGPDFIDTGLHKMITGRPSRNLDLWMCGEEYVKACFHKHSTGVDISVVEGVMGLYDGDFSTARLADAINLPVILIVDAYGMAESAGAIVKGFGEFSASPVHPFTHSPIIGVIFNRVASDKHYERLKKSIRDMEVLGYLPRDLNFKIPHRHLGLTVAEENPIAGENIERLADAVLEHIDIEAIYRAVEQQTSRAAGYYERNYSFKNYCSAALLLCCSESGLSPTSAKIAVAYDKAFCFYYEDNLDLLKDAGAEIIKFSPLYDQTIPEADAVYIGGGYPELYAGQLSKNQSMLEAIYNWADSGKPIYAECGGLMYLSQGIHDFEGTFFKMAGVFPFETQMKKGRSHLGYREIQLKEDCIVGKKGDKLRGHEFHYSEIKDRAEDRKFGRSEMSTVYSLKNNSGERIFDEGYRLKNTLASYMHLHFGSNSNIAKTFIDFIKE